MVGKSETSGPPWRRAGRSKQTAGASSQLDEVPHYLNFQSVPSELLSPVRRIINRYELRSGEQLPTPIAVTSAKRGEGATMVSQALATVLAHEHGKFVLWMDCSWLAANAPYDPDQPSGLVDILEDGSNVLDAVHSSPDLSQLSWLVEGNIPSGQRHMIVRSAEFEQLLALLEKEFDYVILDTPPLLGSGDGLPLLRRSNAYVMVARHRAASVAEVRQATELAAPTPNVGAIVTDYRSKIPRWLRRLIGD